METEDIVELGIIAVVLIAVAYILAKALGFLSAPSDPNSPTGKIGSGISTLLSPVGDAISTLTGDASVPLSNANLFFQGIDNLFTTGSIYGDPSTN